MQIKRFKNSLKCMHFFSPRTSIDLTHFKMENCIEKEANTS